MTHPPRTELPVPPTAGTAVSTDNHTGSMAQLEPSPFGARRRTRRARMIGGLGAAAALAFAVFAAWRLTRNAEKPATPAGHNHGVAAVRISPW